MKKSLPIVIIHYFGSELITCLSVIALMASVAIIIHGKITWDFVLLIFLLAVAVYFFDFFDDKKDYDFDKDSEEKTVRKDRTLFKIFTALLIIACIIIALIFGSISSLFFLFVLIAIGFLYPVYFKKFTKQIVGFKDFYVAIAWNLILIFYFIYYSIPFSTTVIFILLLTFSRDFMGASFCDVKDRGLDKENGLQTFAVALKEPNLYALLYFLNFLSLVIIGLGVFLKILPEGASLLIFPVILTTVLITLGRKFKNYSEVLIDYEYIFWYAILLIGRIYGKF